MDASLSTVGSVMSDGNLWIMFGVVAPAVVGATVLVIVKKKKKTVAADGINQTDEE